MVRDRLANDRFSQGTVVIWTRRRLLEQAVREGRSVVAFHIHGSVP
jgi:hypothetical protein